MTQSSDWGTGLETKRNILLRQEERKMYEEWERLGGGRRKRGAMDDNL